MIRLETVRCQGFRSASPGFGGVVVQPADVATARLLFIVMMGAGIRRGEALGLRWRAVSLADPDGPVLRVEETWTRNRVDTPKSEAGRRTIALGNRLAGALFEHRAGSAFCGEDELVFANPRTGRPFDVRVYAAILRKAFERAGVEGYVRPCHDLRHSSITNSAAAGTTPEALMSRAGHSDYATTRRYIDLAGERFREDADRLEQRLWGRTSTTTRYQVVASPQDSAPEEDATPLSV